MLRNFGFVQTRREYDLMRCLGEIDLLKQKVGECVVNGYGAFNIGDISLEVTSTHIILKKSEYVAKVENKQENLPNLYVAYWNAYMFDPSEVFYPCIGDKE